jgi:hydrogenase-4 component E
VKDILDIALVVLVLTNLLLLGSSRIGACIRLSAVQGVLLSLVTIAVQAEALSVHAVIMALATLGLKGVAFPRLLSLAMREAEIRREVEPIIGFTASIVLGTLAFVFSLWLGSRLPLPAPVVSPLVVPVALFTILCGLLLILSRKKALSQVLGYLVLENGIYIFGVALALKEPIVVEMGVLLDVFAAVFVMGITVFHINREFESQDIDRLSSLGDGSP